MQIATPGLVLREVKFRESDRMLTILTPRGVISASAKGSLRLKSKLFSACGLFCYSDFTLFESRGGVYTVDEAQVKQVFFDLRKSVEGLALAMYLAEAAATFQPAGQEAEAMLRLLLNCLYLIAGGKKDLRLLRAAAELRLASLAGFMPDVVLCAGCGKYEGGGFYFDVAGGTLLCEDCARKENKTPNLDAAALAALRHALLAEDKKIFSFALAPESLARLGWAAQASLLTALERPPKTLEFLNTVLPNEIQRGKQNNADEQIL